MHIEQQIAKNVQAKFQDTVEFCWKGGGELFRSFKKMRNILYISLEYEIDRSMKFGRYFFERPVAFYCEK